MASSKLASPSPPDEPSDSESASVGKDSKIELICKHWSHPKGQDVPAVVITMNHFVRSQSENILIPCEIALTTFSVKMGISESYWTIIDPVTIPLGKGVKATNSAIKYGLPKPGFCEHFQDYRRIVKEIEDFMKTVATKDESIDTIIFCMEADIKATQGGMEWLYEKVGKKFPFRIVELEDLLVTLSLGGLENISEGSGNGFLEVVSAFRKAVKTTTSGSGATSNTLRARLSSFSSVSGLDESSYSTIGRFGCDRKAYSKQDEHPYAMLGGFLIKEHARLYLTQSDFLHIEKLACDFHQGKVRIRGHPPEEPVDKLVNCSLIRARNLLYLALDAMIPNYKISARRGAHYPVEGKIGE